MQHNDISDLYEEFYKPLLYYAIKVLGDYSTAEDAVAEMFATIIRLNRLEYIKTNPKAYLFIALRNTCRNIIRKQNTDNKKHEAYFALLQNEGHDLIELEIKTLVIKEIYDHANKLLAPRAKDIFFLKYFIGLTNIKIAKALNIKTTTVRSSLMQSIQKIKPWFEMKSNTLMN
jgi:RNA polymerase sigma-70 factor (ECF subfamily)